MTKYGLITKDARQTIIHADGASFSTLKKFSRSALHAQYAITHPPEPSVAMEFGNAVHLAVLEPDRFSSECAVAPAVDRRTKEGKATWAAFQAENVGATILTQDQFTACAAMRDAVWNHPVACEMLSGIGHAEVGVIWKDAETERPCKGLIDRLGEFDGWTWVIDLKTCQDASPKEFAKTVANQGYHAQASMLLDGCNTVAPRERRFAWIAVEKEPPHAVAIYEAPLVMVAAGQVLYRKWLSAFISAKEHNYWPGYPPDIQLLELPKWAIMGAFDE